MRKLVLICVTSIMATARAEYNATELFTVGWGDSDNQLKASPSARIDPGTPEDPADDYRVPGSGPNLAFVDKDENVIFGSYSNCQLKGFSKKGSLIFDLSCQFEGNNQSIYGGYPDNLYVDSLSRIYLTTFNPSNYLPVFDYQGYVYDSLKPFSNYPDSPITGMNWTPSGSLFVFSSNLGWVTYSQGVFNAGGSWCFWASDGTIRSVRETGPSSVRFYKFQNPDNYGNPAIRDSTDIQLPIKNIIYATLLNGGDGTKLYMMLDMLDNDIFSYEIRIFDLDLNFLDSLTLNLEPAYYDSFIKPFVAFDGTIHEFRCLADGLHVIKWRKQ